MWAAGVAQDARYAVRAMRTRPGIAAVAILTFALGIGASTAVFSIISAVLLEPLPYPAPDRLVFLVHTWPGGGPLPSVSPPKFQIWRSTTTALADAAAYFFFRKTVASGEAADDLAIGQVSATFFSLFGARPAHGRTFTSDEDRPRVPRVAVLSHGYATRRFGDAARAVGQSVSIDGVAHSVVGVLDAKFDARSADPYTAAAPDVWLPLQLDPNSRSDGNTLIAAARLAPGTSMAAAQAQTASAVEVFRREFPGVLETTAGLTLTLAPVASVIAGDTQSTLTLLLIAVGLLLLIVCVNLACLMLIRTSARQREFALRAAAGASRARIIRQVILESVVTGASGGALGALIAFPALRALLALQPGSLPRIAADGSDITMDWRVFLFTSVVATLSAIVSALIPALRASRVDLTSALKAASGATASTAGGERGRATLVVAEIALASLLLVGGALLIRSIMAIHRVDPGFDPSGVVTMRMSVTDPRFGTTATAAAWLNRGASAIRERPGVVAAGITAGAMPFESESVGKITALHRTVENSVVGRWRVVSPDTLNVLRTPLIRGRTFTDRDHGAAPPVVIVDQPLALQLWGDRNPIGDMVQIFEGAGPDFADPPRQVIGVVGGMRYNLELQPRPGVYVPLAQLPDNLMALFNRGGGYVTWVVRTDGEPRLMAGAVQDALRSTIGAPVTRVSTLEEIAAASTSRRRFETTLVTIFGASALLLAALGVYGVAAYSVQQRTREIGIRVALGAAAPRIRRMVLARGLILTLLGLTIGLSVALAASRWLSSFLFGVTPHDSIAFASAALILAVVTTVSVWLPARRATRIDPIVALRAD